MTRALIGPKAWSASAVSRFIACPRAFAFQYVEKAPRLDEMPLHVRAGTVGHAGLEAAYRERVSARSHGPMIEHWDAAKAAIATAWDDEKMPEPHLSEGQWDRVHKAVADTLEDQTQSWEHVAGVEEKFYLRGDGAAVIGFVDLLLRPEEDLAVIRDWKFRSSLPRPEDLALDPQLCLYGEMVRRRHPWAKRVRAEHYMPPIAERIEDTADWPCRNSSTYIVIWPSVICPRTALTATHAYAA